MKRLPAVALLALLWPLQASVLSAQSNAPAFKVIAFASHLQDKGHRSFVREASQWFPRMAQKHGFSYEATSDWSNLNDAFLSRCQVVVFLDGRPEAPAQRSAFEKFMEHGGGWMGFHFAAFALTPSGVPQNWDWYHNQFVGAGEWKGNTWKPTPAILRLPSGDHPATRRLPATFKASANEWYKWSKDLRQNPDLKILAFIDPASFPLGTGPKPQEIWHDGFYPVVWTNVRYRMIYLNMGHNDVDYANNDRDLSQTFGNEDQDRLVLDALMWLGGR